VKFHKGEKRVFVFLLVNFDNFLFWYFVHFSGFQFFVGSSKGVRGD
jgi:hypothetical protein